MNVAVMSLRAGYQAVTGTGGTASRTFAVEDPLAAARMMPLLPRWQSAGRPR